MPITDDVRNDTIKEDKAPKVETEKLVSNFETSYGEKPYRHIVQWFSQSG